MKQFFIFAIVGAATGILDLIDSAFANNISLDSICVMASFAILLWLINALCQIGEYAYNVKQKYESECFALQVISIVIVSLILICFRNQIPYLYKLTETQYKLFSLCLLYKGIFLFVGKLEHFFRNYVQMKCMNKHLITANIIFYVTMIGLDALVIFMHGECYHLVITTGIADLITCLYYILFCHVFREFKMPKIKNILECIRVSKDILIDRILSKVSTVICNICASHLGTQMYAIHGVCYAVASGVEEITAALYLNQIVKLKDIKNIVKKHERCQEIAKSTYFPAVIMCYVITIGMVFPMKGELNTVEVLYFSLLYGTQCMMIQLYENYRAFLTSCERTESLRLGGLFGFIVRVPISLISIFTPIGIYGFTFGPGIDFLCRGIFYKYKANKLLENYENSK